MRNEGKGTKRRPSVGQLCTIVTLSCSPPQPRTETQPGWGRGGKKDTNAPAGGLTPRWGKITPRFRRGSSVCPAWGAWPRKPTHTAHWRCAVRLHGGELLRFTTKVREVCVCVYVGGCSRCVIQKRKRTFERRATILVLLWGKWKGCFLNNCAEF